jgi:hypothetical protein
MTAGEQPASRSSRNKALLAAEKPLAQEGEAERSQTPGALAGCYLVGVTSHTIPWLGALPLAYYDPEGRLVYASRPGTGIKQAELVRLWRRLAACYSADQLSARLLPSGETRPAYRPITSRSLLANSSRRKGLRRNSSVSGNPCSTARADAA